MLNQCQSTIETCKDIVVDAQQKVATAQKESHWDKLKAKGNRNTLIKLSEKTSLGPRTQRKKTHSGARKARTLSPWKKLKSGYRKQLIKV